MFIYLMKIIKTIKVHKEQKFMYFGCHVSISKGYYEAAKIAHQIGAKSFQYFSKNPRVLVSKILIITMQRNVPVIVWNIIYFPLYILHILQI